MWENRPCAKSTRPYLLICNSHTPRDSTFRLLEVYLWGGGKPPGEYCFFLVLWFWFSTKHMRLVMRHMAAQWDKNWITLSSWAPLVHALLMLERESARLVDALADRRNRLAIFRWGFCTSVRHFAKATPNLGAGSEWWSWRMHHPKYCHNLHGNGWIDSMYPITQENPIFIGKKKHSMHPHHVDGRGWFESVYPQSTTVPP